MAQDDVDRSVEWAVLTAQFPGCDAVSAGILLVDLASDELYVKLLPALSRAEDEVVEFWCELPKDLIVRSKALGGRQGCAGWKIRRLIWCSLDLAVLKRHLIQKIS